MSELIALAGLLLLFLLILLAEKISPTPFYVPTPDGVKQVTRKEFERFLRDPSSY
jgi:hypothetical protein